MTAIAPFDPSEQDDTSPLPLPRRAKGRGSRVGFGDGGGYPSALPGAGRGFTRKQGTPPAVTSFAAFADELPSSSPAKAPARDGPRRAALADDHSDEEAEPRKGPLVAGQSSSSTAAPAEDGGLFGRLTQGAQSMFGLVTEVVSLITADSDTDDEAQPGKKAAQGSKKEVKKEVRSSTVKDADDVASVEGSKPSISAVAELDEDESYVEYLTDFCVYLGMDVSAEPELISEVDTFLKRKQLPDGWELHHTGPECEIGAGHAFYVNAITGHSQWMRPDEDDLLRSLCGKMRRIPTVGSRLFFAMMRDRAKAARIATLTKSSSALLAMRPLLRALPDGSVGLQQRGMGAGGVIHVPLYNQFPMLDVCSLEAFASYFGIAEKLSQSTSVIFRQLWLLKVAALCPVPQEWSFKFDESSLAAVFVDNLSGKASRYHPLDPFFLALMERLLYRHHAFAAKNESKISATALGQHAIFLLDRDQRGQPSWLKFPQALPARRQRGENSDASGRRVHQRGPSLVPQLAPVDSYVRGNEGAHRGRTDAGALRDASNMHGSSSSSLPSARRHRAELKANLQWLCRVFLETREQLYNAHKGTPNEVTLCTGLREELDVVAFRTHLEEALTSSSTTTARHALVRILRRFMRRALHNKLRTGSSVQLHEEFKATCAGQEDSKTFAQSVIPKVLQQITRIILAGVSSPLETDAPEAEGNEFIWDDTDTEATSVQQSSPAPAPASPAAATATPTPLPPAAPDTPAVDTSSPPPQKVAQLPPPPFAAAAAPGTGPAPPAPTTPPPPPKAVPPAPKAPPPALAPGLAKLPPLPFKADKTTEEPQAAAVPEEAVVEDASTSAAAAAESTQVAELPSKEVVVETDWAALDEVIQGGAGPNMAELEADANNFLTSHTADMFLARAGRPEQPSSPSHDVRAASRAAAGQTDAGGGGQGSDNLSAQYSFRGGSHELEDWAEDDEQQDEKPPTGTEPVVMAARRPFVTGDLRSIADLGKAPLLNAEGLVDLLIPGAELTTEGLLGQMSDEELVLFAYSLEQVTDAANKRLVTELKQRDEWRSVCTHRKEYLQLLDGSLVGPLGH